jgi:hypothetical protein
MLCDSIAADAFRNYRGFSATQEKILVAQKFALAPDFALAADGLTDNFAELERIAPFCRLPYRLCWFEFAQADRAHWRTAPLHYPSLQSSPLRVGFLAEALRDDLACWRTTLFWSLKNPAHHGLNASPLVMIYDTAKPMGPDKLASLVNSDLAEFDCDIPESVAEEYYSKLARSDWAGEIRYLFAVLGLLNTRNVAEAETVSYERLNKQRVRADKPPLSTHTLLKIRSVHRRALTGKGSGVTAETRAHFVRGHFKTRKTGIFFWRPYMRGDLAHGYAAKDYEVGR